MAVVCFVTLISQRAEKLLQDARDQEEKETVQRLIWSICCLAHILSKM